MSKAIVKTDYVALSRICADLRDTYDMTGDRTALGALAAVLTLNLEPSDEDDFFEKYGIALQIAVND